MALSLGEILVTIAADVSELDKGLGQGQIKLDNFAGAASTAAGTIAVVTAAAAAAAAAVTLITNSAIQTADRFQNLSDKTAISAESLQKFDIAGKTVGLTAEQIGLATLKMSKNLFDAGEASTKALDAIGISSANLRGLSPEQQFLAISEAIGKVQDPALQAAASMTLFGKAAGPDILAGIRTGFLEVAKEAEALGFVISNETVAATDEFGDRVGFLGSGFDALITTIGSAIATNESLGMVVESLIQTVSEMISWVNQNESAIQNWVNIGIIFAIEFIRRLLEVIGGLVAGFGFLIGAVGKVIEVWGGFLSTISNVLDGIVGLAQAVVSFAAGVPGIGQALIIPFQALLKVADGVTETMKTNATAVAETGKSVGAFGDEVTAAGAKVVGVANQLGVYEEKLLDNVAAGDQAAETMKKLPPPIFETAAAAGEAEKAFAKLVTSLTGGTIEGLTADMAALEKAVLQVEKSGTLTAAQMAELGKTFSEARTQEATLGAEAARLANQFEENARKASMAKVANELFAAAVKLADESIKPTASDLAMFSGGLDDATKAAIDAAIALGDKMPGGVSKADIAIGRAATATDRFRETMSLAADVSQVFGDGIGNIVNQAVGLVSGLSGAADAFKGFAAIGKEAGAGGGIGGMFSGLKSSFSTAAKDAGGGIMGGLSGAFEVAGPILAMLGPAISAIGKVVGFLFKSQAEKVADEVERDFGTKISDALAKSIADTAKSLDLGRFEATLLHFSDIIGEAGGAAELGLEKVGSTIMDLQNAVEMGVVPTEEGLAQIGESFSLLAEDAVKAGEVADASLIQVVMRARQLGQEIPEIAAFVADQLAVAAEGVTALIGKSMGEGEEVQFGGIQVATPEDAQAQATIFSAVFFATLSEQGLLAAVDALGPAFAEMQAKLAEFGAGVDFGGVARFFELAADPQFRPLLEGIDGLNQALVGLSNAGFLTKDAFSAIQQQGQASFEQLMAAGLTEQEALMQIAPLLQSQIDAANTYGFELDENTQKLIGQAEAAGIGFKTDPMQRMVDVLEVIATKLGATAEELGAVGGAGEAAATQIGDGFVATTTEVGESMNVLSTTTDETYKSMTEGAISAGASVLAVGGAAIKAAGDFNSLANSARAAAAAAGAVPGPPGGGGGGRRGDAEGFQFGGLVTGPTLGMLGEAGPELVLPLSDSARAIEVAGAVSAGRQAPVPMSLTVQIGSETFLAEIEDATRTNRIRIHERSIQTFGD